MAEISNLSLPSPSFQQWKDLAELRLQEAKTLYENGLYKGAYYLGGYVIEFALKAVICKLLDLDDFFSNPHSSGFKVHQAKKLIIWAGLQKQLALQVSIDTNFQGKWAKVDEKWSEQYRYNSDSSINQFNTLDFLNAIGNPDPSTHPESLYFIPPSDSSTTVSGIGVFTWIKTFW